MKPGPVEVALTKIANAAATTLHRVPREQAQLIAEKERVEERRDELWKRSHPGAANPELDEMTHRLGEIGDRLGRMKSELRDAAEAHAVADRRLGWRERRPALEKQLAAVGARFEPIERKLTKIAADDTSHAQSIAAMEAAAVEAAKKAGQKEVADMFKSMGIDHTGPHAAAAIQAATLAAVDADPVLRLKKAAFEHHRHGLAQQRDQLIAERKAIDDEVEQLRKLIREQSAYEQELEHAEALAEYVRIFTTYRLAHREAFESDPEAPNIKQLSFGIERDLIEQAEQGAEVSIAGSVKRLLQERLGLA